MTNRDGKILSLARAYRQGGGEDLTEVDAILAGETLPPVRYIAFGDSNTNPTGGYSWIPYIDASKAQLVGGVQRGGFKSADMAWITAPTPCDIAVIMAGSNDVGPVGWGTDYATVRGAFRDMVVKSTTPRVLVSSIAPRSDYDGREAQRTLEFNDMIQRYSAEMGWKWVDPWKTLRAPDGRWAHHTVTVDGVHPIPQAAERVGQIIAASIRDICW